MAALKSEPTLGYDIVGVIDIGDEADLQATIAVSGRRTSARRMLQSAYVRLGARFVVIAVDARDMIRTSQVVEELQRLTIPFAIIPPICGMSVLGLQAQYFFSHDVVLLTGRNNLSKPLSRLVKRAFDIAVASALLVLLAPFLLFTAAVIRHDGGPALFGHPRIGKDGRTFRCFKFRTMVVDADRVLGELLARDPAAAAEWSRDFKLRNDPRVTAIGRFLRRTSLDELPQLINVIRGEMSLVGPRPIIKAEADEYGDEISYYYSVAPGITGLWQVSGRNSVSYPRRIALNTWYVKNWSLWHDITILFKTVRVVLTKEGAY
jgi:undecaprenyl-phosphate galactose phosphotransferase